MPLRPNLDEIEQFLTKLNRGPNGKFTFLAIDDDKTRNAPPSPEKHGSLAEATNLIGNAAERGYGTYVTINQTDLRGRKTMNIVAVRALFVDLDGAPILPVLNCEVPPDIVVESSRGKYHAYWPMTARLRLTGSHRCRRRSLPNSTATSASTIFLASCGCQALGTKK